jgi:ABC-type branched-subunit amino acid transport system substrate-binding protein
MPRIALPIAALAVLVAAISCSLLTRTDQCSSDADCANKGRAFNGTTCTDGICLAPLVPEAGECDKHADCLAALGDYHVCRASDHACISLVSQDCPIVIGDYKSDNAVFYGSVLDFAGTGRDVNGGVELAFAEIATKLGGLPTVTGANARPIVLIECDERASVTRAATFLVKTVQVPAIIGASTTESTIALAQVAVLAGVALVSPSATGVSLTTLPDDGLVWRTVASDRLEGQVMGASISDVEAQLRASAPTTSVRVAMVASDTAYATGIAAAIELTANFNRKSVSDNARDGNYDRFDYPAAATDRALGDVASQVAAFAPHIVVMVSGSEGVRILKALEAVDAGSVHPEYIVASAMGNADLLDYVKSSDAVRARLRGTLPGKPESSLFGSFRDRYLAKYPEGAPDPGAANAYDATYVLSYATVATGNRPLTGRNILASVRRLVSSAGETIDSGPDDVLEGLGILNGASSFDLNGVSGPLDFDLTTGDVETDVEVWCLSRDGAGGVALHDSGERYSAAAKAMVGRFTPCP